jgi:hypothetical protein
MARLRCSRCGIETLNLTGWTKHPRCSNCNAPLPIPSRRFGRTREEGQEPGVDSAVTLRTEPDPA